MSKINYLDRKFAELTWDAGFKATFRDPNNKEALMLLLNTFRKYSIASTPLIISRIAT